VSLVEGPCPLCRSAESKFLFAVRDWALRVTSDVFGVRRCRSCGCGYLSPCPSPDDIARYYPREYYWSYEGGGRSLTWKEVLTRREPQLKAKARLLEAMPPGRLLDVGAQKGDFLWFMQQRGWTVEGVEIDNNVPNPAGMPIRYGDFLTMELDCAGYDAVTAWAVLEHVHIPDQFIRKAASLLKRGGRFVAVVTNFNSVQGRFFKADDYPRHLTFFTQRAISRIAENVGLCVRRISTDQDIFGTQLNGFMLFLLKRLGGYTADEAYFEWKHIEDPTLFFAKWRGAPSHFVLNVSRLDRALTRVPERLLDACGFGFNLTFELEKV
jgi:2-polyprenyl-3-methyl-5-hydroxy-6-metoxy-1,4-benzoquinol methylase